MAYFAVVTGAPCSGKSTYVEKMRKTGDLIIDLDLIHQAIGSKQTHNHEVGLFPFALAARTAILHQVAGMTQPPNVWYVACQPSPSDWHLFPANAYEVSMPTGVEECKARAIAAGRPGGTDFLIDRYFAERMSR